MGRKKKETQDLQVGSIQFVYSSEWKEDWVRVYASLIEEELRSQIERRLS